jgi:hypothetical protein
VLARCLWGPFPAPSSRTGHDGFPGVDGGVAGVADYEGFAPAFCHVLCPRWLWLPGPGEVGGLADLVNFGAAGVPQISHRPARNRVISSLRRMTWAGGQPSASILFVCSRSRSSWPSGSPAQNCSYSAVISMGTVSRCDAPSVLSRVAGIGLPAAAEAGGCWRRPGLWPG